MELKDSDYVSVFLSGNFPHGQRWPDLVGAISVVVKRVTGRIAGIFDVVPPHALARTLQRVDFVVADISSVSPSVMWEVGVANGVGVPVMLVSQDPGSVPRDLRGQQILMYSPNAPASHLEARLEDALREILGGSELATAQPVARKLFVSYCHEDAEYLERLLVHLRPLERLGLVDPWSDRRLEPGDAWREAIANALHSARVAVLLISADFLASEFIVSTELPRLLESAQRHGTRIIPLILKPSRFVRDAALSQFQAINPPGRPVIGMTEVERETLYVHLAETIEQDIPMRDA